MRGGGVLLIVGFQPFFLVSDTGSGVHNLTLRDFLNIPARDAAVKYKDFSIPKQSPT